MEAGAAHAQPSIRGGAASGQEGGMTSVLFTNVRIPA